MIVKRKAGSTLRTATRSWPTGTNGSLAGFVEGVAEVSVDGRLGDAEVATEADSLELAGVRIIR